ncbi:MAG: hypothetical protein KF799_12555 [Bdellovibrionales bacterium]|nr:hypothetical protein [Bdellovibrionales bacterium]
MGRLKLVFTLVGVVLVTMAFQNCGADLPAAAKDSSSRLSGGGSPAPDIVETTVALTPREWQPNQNTTVGDISLNFQGDGNLVLRKAGAPLWSSDTGGRDCSVNCLAAFQGDGNLVIYQNNTAIWSLGAGSSTDVLVISIYSPHLSIRRDDGSIRWQP